MCIFLAYKEKMAECFKRTCLILNNMARRREVGLRMPSLRLLPMPSMCSSTREYIGMVYAGVKRSLSDDSDEGRRDLFLVP